MSRVTLLHDFRLLPYGDGTLIKAFGDARYGRIVTDGLDALQLDYSIPEVMEWEVPGRTCEPELRRFLIRLRQHPILNLESATLMGMAWDEEYTATPVDRITLAAWDEVKHLVKRLETIQLTSGYAERLAGLVCALVRDIPFLASVDCVAAAPLLTRERLGKERGSGIESLAGFIAARWVETFDRPDVSALVACSKEALSKATATVNETTFAIRGDVTGVSVLLLDVYCDREKLKFLSERIMGAGADAVYGLVMAME